jgi:MFS family permease
MPFLQVTWVATAYLLTQAGFMLFLGQVLSIAPTKSTYLILIGTFELGSLVYDVAPTMPALIFGRALAGVGTRGIMIAAMLVCAQISPPEQRSLLFGLAGGMSHPFVLCHVVNSWIV